MEKRLFRVLFTLIVCSLVLSAYSIASSMDIFEGVVPEPVGASAGHWLEGWQYRKAHNITGSTAGVQVNYPVIIDVHYDNGFDFGEVVYLHFKCRRDFGDIRFTDFKGDTLDYWIQQKTDGVRALTWVEINYIPISPNYTTIYIYYGNPNATTTSNKEWVHSFATDFEDATNQGWLISWSSHVISDGVSTSAFQGNYSREACREYWPRNYEMLEKIQNTVYLASGSYRVEVAARQVRQDPWVTPREIMLMIDGVVVEQVSDISTAWHWLSGNFTVTTDHYVEFVVAFRVWIGNLGDWSRTQQRYSIDSAFARKWCDPEPIHGTWGKEKGDTGPPQTVSIELLSDTTRPYERASQAERKRPKT